MNGRKLTISAGFKKSVSFGYGFTYINAIVEVLQETEKALQITRNGETVWMPKSVLTPVTEDGNTVSVAQWFRSKLSPAQVRCLKA